MRDERDWVNWALGRIEADFQRSADTHLIGMELPALPGIDLYLKDESIHPSGSLKHRLARSLFLYGLCNGWIRRDRPVIEASSGNTAVSEAYFARLLELPFIAVMPVGTSRRKIEQVEFQGGRCEMVPSGEIYRRAADMARELDGHYMDQFTYAERVTDWRGNNNIARSIFEQMARERFPDPAWVVVSAGTGGTSSTIGRYIRYRRYPTGLCVADPENSVFFEHWSTGRDDLSRERSSRIEGIGRPRVEPSFMASVVDHMVKVPDAASFAALRFTEGILGRRVGASTGTNLVAAFELASAMAQHDRQGSIVTMLCDGGDRYLDTGYSDQWLAGEGLDVGPWLEELEAFYRRGRLERP